MFIRNLVAHFEEMIALKRLREEVGDVVNRGERGLPGTELELGAGASQGGSGGAAWRPPESFRAPDLRLISQASRPTREVLRPPLLCSAPEALDPDHFDHLVSVFNW